MRYIEDLRKGIRELLTHDPDVYLLGEDIVDPYGGAFKVTKGLSNEFPDRLIPTPMSESGFCLMSVGMALSGLKPITEIMFGDFITLCTDAIINHAIVLRFITDRPIHWVIRAPMGGYRGYGATHSKCMETMFLSFPNLKIISPSIAHRPGTLLKHAIQLGIPVIFQEYKLDYGRILLEGDEDISISQTDNTFPTVFIYPKNATYLNIVIISYGELIHTSIEILKKGIEEDIPIGVLAISDLTLDLKSILPFLHMASRVLVLSEGYESFGWAPYVALKLREMLPSGYRIAYMGARNHVLGVAPTLEEYVLPIQDRIVGKLKEMGVWK